VYVPGVPTGGAAVTVGAGVLVGAVVGVIATVCVTAGVSAGIGVVGVTEVAAPGVSGVGDVSERAPTWGTGVVSAGFSRVQAAAPIVKTARDARIIKRFIAQPPL
jgi:hypothetical protein